MAWLIYCRAHVSIYRHIAGINMILELKEVSANGDLITVPIESFVLKQFFNQFPRDSCLM